MLISLLSKKDDFVLLGSQPVFCSDGFINLFFGGGGVFPQGTLSSTFLKRWGLHHQLLAFSGWKDPTDDGILVHTSCSGVAARASTQACNKNTSCYAVDFCKHEAFKQTQGLRRLNIFLTIRKCINLSGCWVNRCLLCLAHKIPLGSCNPWCVTKLENWNGGG